VTVTCIHRSAWVIAWDAAAGRHVYRNDIDLAFEKDRIIHVGKDYRGRVDRTIDGSSSCVMPGLVNVHTHLCSECIGRGLIEELGNPDLYMSGIFDSKKPYVLSKLTDACGGNEAQLKANRAATNMAISELLLSGATTVVDLGPQYEGWLDNLAATGIRAYVGPMFREAEWSVPTGASLEYRWDRKHGRESFEMALKVVDCARNHTCGRLDGIIAPSQVDTCTAELLREALGAAKARRMKMTIHCSQGVVEFQEMVRRHGMTPVQWMHSEGLLGPHTLLGHAIFLDHHSWTQWWTRKDISLLAETGTSVAHCPTVFSRYGQMMEGVGHYIRSGVNVGIGTDTEPHNMLEELRTATILGKAAARSVQGVWLSEIFHAATIGGANALGRNDIGRLAPGAKADIVLLDLNQPMMRPLRDPLRSVVFSAADRAVQSVFVDGRQVVAAGEVSTIDRRQNALEMQEVQEGYIRNTPYADFQKRSVDELAPMSLPLHAEAAT
jgi:5-methylthioadenosine/S-adenosylhomocysteine deaminase